jgi:sortase A
MKRKLGTFCMIVGTALIIAALSLFLYNKVEEKKAGVSSENVVETLRQDILPEGTTLTDTSEDENLNSAPFVIEKGREMSSIEIDGENYIGYVRIPDIGLYLPVQKEWSYAGLKISPGRFYGNLYSDDLVIAGHNYDSHFGRLCLLSMGAEVDFIDVEGTIWRYTVSDLETLAPTQVEDMVAKQEGDDWNLTLFTCTPGGRARYALRCVRVKY